MFMFMSCEHFVTMSLAPGIVHAILNEMPRLFIYHFSIKSYCSFFTATATYAPIISRNPSIKTKFQAFPAYRKMDSTGDVCNGSECTSKCSSLGFALTIC
jgi:hypothetical protein